MQYQEKYDSKDTTTISEKLPPLRHVLLAGMGAGIITR